MFNVSPRAVQSAKAVIERGTPELVAAVERGEVAVLADDCHHVGGWQSRGRLLWTRRGSGAWSSRLPSANARKREENAMEANRDKPRLIQASRWGELGPGWPSPAGLRHLIAKAATNGFDAVIRRVGRVVLVDVDAFNAWVDAQHVASLEAERQGAPRSLSALEVPHG